MDHVQSDDLSIIVEAHVAKYREAAWEKAVERSGELTEFSDRTDADIWKQVAGTAPGSTKKPRHKAGASRVQGHSTGHGRGGLPRTVECMPLLDCHSGIRRETLFGRRGSKKALP